MVAAKRHSRISCRLVLVNKREDWEYLVMVGILEVGYGRMVRESEQGYCRNK